MATRRSNVRVELPPIQSATTKQESRQSPDVLLNNSKPMSQLDARPSFSSAWLPTLMEALLLSIYPATLLLGSLFSTLTIDDRTTPYIAYAQAYDPDHAPSYFAKKSNVFNVYFVKIGWAWTTAALALFILGSRALGPVSYATAPQNTLTRRRLQALARWTLLTGVWYAFTQQFFGPALIDRGFRFTGGKCEVALSEDVSTLEATEQISDAKAAATRAACRLVGGQWQGGHDISGHVFLLVMGSAMIWFEVLPIVLGWAGLTRARKIKGQTEKASLSSEEAKTLAGGAQATEHGVIFSFALAVAGLSWWMLFMTAVYFHTWFEKFTGLVVALAAIYITYFLPRAVPVVRQVLGVPGV